MRMTNLLKKLKLSKKIDIAEFENTKPEFNRNTFVGLLKGMFEELKKISPDYRKGLLWSKILQAKKYLVGLSNFTVSMIMVLCFVMIFTMVILGTRQQMMFESQEAGELIYRWNGKNSGIAFTSVSIIYLCFLSAVWNGTAVQKPQGKVKQQGGYK